MRTAAELRDRRGTDAPFGGATTPGALALVQHVRQPIAVVRRDGRVRWVNDALAATFGWGAEDVADQSAFSLVHPADVLRARAGLRLACRQSGLSGPLQLRVRRPGGAWLNVEVSATNLLRHPGVAGVLVYLEAVEAPALSEHSDGVLDRLSEVVFETDPVGRWTYLNRAWTDITGFTVTESIGRAFLEFLHPDEVEPTLALFQSVVSGETDHCHHEGRYRRASGGYVWMELRASVLRDGSGTIVGNAGTIVDITERRRAQDLLAEQTRVLELIAQDAPLASILQVLSDLLRRSTASPARVLLHHGDGAPGVPAPPHATGCAVPIVSASGAELGRFVLRDTDVLQPGLHEVAVRSAQLAAIAIERRQAREEARRHALHDPLTGLPNRLLLGDRLERAVTQARRNGRMGAFLLVDLDHFKQVNDTLGRDAGDELLRLVADRLDGPVRDVDTVARLGGDEFVVIVNDLVSKADAEVVARRVHEALEPRVTVHGVSLRVNASLGIALFPEHGTDLTTLLRRADAAMYRAKDRRGEHAVYDDEHDDERLQHVGLIGELRAAIDSGSLLLHYQPKIDLRNGGVVGVEALCRWPHPRRGLVPPDEFIPLAERSGLIESLTLWVLATALEERQRWAERGFDVALAVNLSAHSLHDARLPEVVEDVARRSGLEAGKLELEITESAVMVDPEGAVAALCRLVDAGIDFSIDDFGTGYSSLAYLKRLPARSIKIDKSLVHDIASEERSAAIVRSTIQLAHDLGIQVVGEGVETERTEAVLGELECDYAQGYRFAAPMPGDQLVEWLAANA